LWLSFWHSDRQRRLIHGTFARYVAPNILATLMRSQHLPTLQGEDHEITVLFADIHGFGTLAEQLSARQLSALLNRYFTPMTWIILEQQGTFDKYIGDRLMAFWNAPTPIPQHPLQAVKAAHAMLNALTPLNLEFQRDYGQSLRVCIAVHTGTAQVGNMGSLELFDYTAIGTDVNLTAKMLRLTREYDVPLLISETVLPAVEAVYYCLEIDRVRVRGLQQVVTLYTPIPHEQVVERHIELRTYEQAHQFYKAGKFDQALHAYSKLAQHYPAQRLYTLYAQRCTHLVAHPPEHWDGVWAAQAQN
jgi:adenylate cyclase